MKVPTGDAGSAGQRLSGGPVLPDPLAGESAHRGRGSAGQRLPGGPVLPDPLAFQQRLEIGNCREQALALQTQHLWQGLSGPGPGRQVPPNGTADLLTSAPAAGGHPCVAPACAASRLRTWRSGCPGPQNPPPHWAPLPARRSPTPPPAED